MKKRLFVVLFSFLAAFAFAAPGSASRKGGRPSGGGRTPSGPNRPAPGANRPAPSKPDMAPKTKKTNSKNSGTAKNTSSEILNYRGSRVLSDSESFSLQSVKTKIEKKSNLTLELSFNKSVNPHSFLSDSILIDGKPLSAQTKFSFNKKGDTIRLELPVESEKINLKIQKIESFDGKMIEELELKDLDSGTGGK